MAAFQTLLNKGCHHQSIRMRWRMPYPPASEGIRRSSFRSIANRLSPDFVKAYMHNGVQVCRASVFGGNGVGSAAHYFVETGPGQTGRFHSGRLFQRPGRRQLEHCSDALDVFGREFWRDDHLFVRAHAPLSSRLRPVIPRKVNPGARRLLCRQQGIVGD
jgi:hypothetical protein